MLISNGYPKKFVEEIERKRANKQEFVPPPEDLVRMFFECVEPKLNCSYAVLPYIKGLTEPLKRLLKQHDIRVTSKPLSNQNQTKFPSPKDRPPAENQTNVIYQIGCSDCPWNYIGETGRAFNTRKKEHVRNVKQFKDGSNIAKHA